ncbi:DUF7528 family protein [Haladaptatus litoreus]|uniref:DUF7528 family protein n=1 Tax=Haladaptatus litoreus TaxID=553468 RepID=UPI000970E1C9
MAIDGQDYELSRETATQLQDAVGDALTERQEFFRTAGTFREDGSYEVSRRGADSSGNAKVFQSFDEMARLFDRLPDEFSAEEVGRTGITGSRRHLLVRHFAEHPDFPCRISLHNPLTAEKESGKSSVAGNDGNAEVGAD